MQLTLWVDYRERQLINLLNQENKENDQLESEKQNEKTFNIYYNDIKMNIRITNLPVADFIFVNEQNDINEYLILVERKTITDLESSIIDGRFREQKCRLISAGQTPDKILYIIEINKPAKKQNMVNGSIINMLYKHHFKILYSKDPTQTLELLATIYKKLYKGDIKLGQQLDTSNTISSVNQIHSSSTLTENMTIETPKLLSKGDNIKKQLFQCSLSVIPGVSMNISQKIADIYSTMKMLMDTYNNLEDDKKREMLLADIKIGTRKIGPVLSKKIWKTLYYNSID